MHKGAILFGVGLFAVVVTICLLLYMLMSKSSFNSGFKSSFKDMNSLDPLTKLFLKNRHARDMYATQLNVDSGIVYDAYLEFLQTATKDTPTTIYESVTEIAQFMQSANLYGQTVDTQKLQLYIQNLDAVLTDFFNGKYITAEQLDGGNKRDQELSDQYSQLNLDQAFVEYLSTVAPNNDEKPIQEDMINAMRNQDYDISRYVEMLESKPDIVGDGKSSKEAYDNAGKRHRLASRPYPGSTNPRVIAEDSPVQLDKFDASKDYAIPYPGILNGQTKDMPSYTQPSRGSRVAYNFNSY